MTHSSKAQSADSKIANDTALVLTAAVLLFMGLLAPRVAAAEDGGTDKLARGIELIEATLDAHGGLDTWHDYSSLSYRMVGFPLTPAVAEPSLSRVDLKHRRNRIESAGYTVGWNGQQAWVTPEPEAVGLPPRFYSLGSFYFIGMPFVFADPGVVLEEVGERSFRGEAYRVLRASYVSGVGHSDRDDYFLYLDKEDHRLALIDHSVTETGVERVTWTFDEWQERGGLLVPAVMTFFPGAPADQPAADGARFTIEDYEPSRSTADASIYDPPSGAVITTDLR